MQRLPTWVEIDLDKLDHNIGTIQGHLGPDVHVLLTVKADEHLLDDYIDPVTGCLMKKVENAGPHMITIRKEIKKDCELKEVQED